MSPAWIGLMVELFGLVLAASYLRKLGKDFSNSCRLVSVRPACSIHAGASSLAVLRKSSDFRHFRLQACVQDSVLSTACPGAMKRPREREEQSLQCEADISSQSIAAPSQSTCAMSMKEEAADQDIESLGFHSPAADPTARVGRSSKKQTNAEMEDGLNKLAQRHAAQFQVKTETGQDGSNVTQEEVNGSRHFCTHQRRASRGAGEANGAQQDRHTRRQMGATGAEA